MIASDPAVENTSEFINGEMLRAFAHELASERVLDGLTEHDADTVCMLLTLDFLKGPAQIAWRINAWLNGDRLGRDEDDSDPFAMCAVMAEALHYCLAAFADPDFAERRANERWPNRDS